MFPIQIANSHLEVHPIFIHTHTYTPTYGNGCGLGPGARVIELELLVKGDNISHMIQKETINYKECF